MDTTQAAWLVVGLALVGANLPFFNERLFACVPLVWSRKPFWVRLLELVLLYLIVGGIGVAFESHIGNRFDQGWEFYAISACLFVVMAYPGFVVRYLRKRH